MNLLAKRSEKAVIKKKHEEMMQIKSDMERVEREMEHTSTLFDLATDDYLIESLIYEQNAQKARLCYLLRQAKEI